MVKVEQHQLSAACRVQQENPKKGASADRYDRYKAARTLQQVLDLGGSRGDIANDMVRGYIQCEDPATQEAILMTANESERRRLPAHLQRKLPPSGQAPPKRPPPPHVPQPRPKKVKSAPKQPGFILYTKVESGVQHWDQRCVEGLSEDAAARVRAETMAAAKKRDLLKIMSQKVYATVDEANAAALETVVALVERLADEDGTPVATDGALHVAEDYLVPNENTIRNSATKDGDRGELLFRTRVSFVADVRRAGEQLRRAEETAEAQERALEQLKEALASMEDHQRRAAGVHFTIGGLPPPCSGDCA